MTKIVAAIAAIMRKCISLTPWRTLRLSDERRPLAKNARLAQVRLLVHNKRFETMVQRSFRCPRDCWLVAASSCRGQGSLQPVRMANQGLGQGLRQKRPQGVKSPLDPVRPRIPQRGAPAFKNGFDGFYDGH